MFHANAGVRLAQIRWNKRQIDHNYGRTGYIIHPGSRAHIGLHGLHHRNDFDHHDGRIYVQAPEHRSAQPRLLRSLRFCPRCRISDRNPMQVHPAEIIWLDQFPKNANGKLDRNLLAEQLLA